MAEPDAPLQAGPSITRRQTQQPDSFNQLKQQGLADIVRLGILIAVPAIALWLPAQLM